MKALLGVIALLAGLAPGWAQTADRREAHLLPLRSVRLLDGPFSEAAEANRQYMLALDTDRLLAPMLREAGLPPGKPPYGNWESSGLDGHMAGHYLSALADMIGSGHDPDGRLGMRLDHMLGEMQRCQQANGDGYIGGVPGSRELWKEIKSGNVAAITRKWVPWYNVHKTFAGLRDAYEVAGREKARDLMVGLGNWAVEVIAGLTEAQMQQMLGAEHGGMNEVLADLFAITGDRKFLEAARRFNHRDLLDPLARRQDLLTGKHANTQIPKVIGFERIASLGGDPQLHEAAGFFWENVTAKRSVAFGGNSVSEHFNDPKDFHGMVESREGPETCNTYNMLRLTEQLFCAEPRAAYIDFYERALCNHLLSAINPRTPGFVYFTPLRPDHYRVYSTPGNCFWCCVGTGMENPGRYGQLIYATARDGRVFVNLFIPSVAKVSDNLTLRQESKFPFDQGTRLTLKLAKPASFSLCLRHPAWVAGADFVVKVNGKEEKQQSAPGTYAAVRRDWQDGDVVEVARPMRTTVEPLPDGSNWVAILHGPILLAAPAGTQDLAGLRADDGRMGHVAHGPLVPLDQVPALLATPEDLPRHIVPDPQAGPLHFRLVDVAAPAVAGGLPLVPFFSLHDQRYQMYWRLTTRDDLASRQAKLAEEERAKAVREAATLDAVAIGEQQPEVEHDFKGENTKTGLHEGRRWRDGASLEYTLVTKGAKAANLVVTYWGGDTGRGFDILVNGTKLASEELKGESPGKFVEKSYPLPPEVLARAANGRITVRFAATKWVAGGLFDLRLMKP